MKKIWIALLVAGLASSMFAARITPETAKAWQKKIDTSKVNWEKAQYQAFLDLKGQPDPKNLTEFMKKVEKAYIQHNFNRKDAIINTTYSLICWSYEDNKPLLKEAYEYAKKNKISYQYTIIDRDWYNSLGIPYDEIFDTLQSFITEGRLSSPAAVNGAVLRLVRFAPRATPAKAKATFTALDKFLAPKAAKDPKSWAPIVKKVQTELAKIK